MKLHPATPDIRDVVMKILRDLPDVMSQPGTTSFFMEGVTEWRYDAKFGDIWYHNLIEKSCDGDLDVCVTECLDDIGARCVVRATVSLKRFPK